MHRLLLLGWLSAAALDGSAQSPPDYHATRTPVPPRIDGTPDEPVWNLAPAITGFTQQEPNTGEPETERTVVRVLYDDDSIYFAAWMYDSRPVTAQLARRDARLAADWFAVYLDTHHDHRSARMFRVNPLGVQRDSLVEEEDDEDRSWDAVWYAAGRVTAEGWTAEIRIPYSQLRFPHLDTHVWGINFHREIARKNEYTRLVHVPRNESGFVARFAHLIGLEGVTPRRRLEILPYAVSRARVIGALDPANPLVDGTEREQDAGLDLKYGLSSNLTLSATINPDFGQVEADPAEVNLSEFELFFEERRPFFLEGADLFRFTGTDLFYSRRIGRPPQGRPAGDFDFARVPAQTTILGAAKLSGKTANGWSIGVLDAVTRSESATLTLGDTRRRSVVEPQTNYFTARLARDFGDDAAVGVILTSVHRSNPSHLEFLHDAAYSGGIDGYRYFRGRERVFRWALYGSRVSGSPAAIARTQSAPARYYNRPDAEHLQLDPTRTALAGWGALAAYDKQEGRWRYTAVARASSPGLELNDIGFQSRVDTITTAVSGGWVDPEPRGRLRSRSWSVSKLDRFNFAGDRMIDRVSGFGFVTFSNYWDADFFWRHDRRVVDDRLTRGGPLAMLPAVSLLSVGFSTDRRKRFHGGAELDVEQGELGGYRREIEVELSWRPSSNIEVEAEPSYTTARNPLQYVRRVGDSLATATYGARYVFAPVERRELELAMRADWAISRTLTVQLYLQPFVATGDYDGFRELQRPSSLDYRVYDEVAYDTPSNHYTIDPDGEGAADPFTFRNPDFNVRSLRGNLVTRWEFRPGSALYVVWAQNRSKVIDEGDFAFSRDLRGVADLPADDVFLVKISYWFGL